MSFKNVKSSSISLSSLACTCMPASLSLTIDLTISYFLFKAELVSASPNSSAFLLDRTNSSTSLSSRCPLHRPTFFLSSESFSLPVADSRRLMRELSSRLRCRSYMGCKTCARSRQGAFVSELLLSGAGT